MATVYLAKGMNDLSHLSVPSGAPVRIIPPTGYGWRPVRDGSGRIETYPLRQNWFLNLVACACGLLSLMAL